MLILFFIYLIEFWRVFLGKITFFHDAFSIDLPLFYFVTDSIHRGVVPFWLPIIDAGLPLYLFINNFCLLSVNKIAAYLVVPLLRNLDTIKIVQLYNAQLLLGFFIYNVGLYFLCRKIFRYKETALICFMVSLFSGMSVGYFASPQALGTIFWVPWILLFGLKALDGFKKANSRKYFLLAVLFMGLSFSDHYPHLYLIYLVSFFIFYTLYNRKKVLYFLKGNARTIIIALVLFFLLILPSIYVIHHLDDFCSAKRVTMSSMGFNLSDLESQWDCFLNLPTLINFILPLGGAGFLSSYNTQAKNVAVDIFPFYIGIIPLILSIIGIIYNRSRYKYIFLLTTILMLFFSAKIFGGYKFLFLLPFFKMFRQYLHYSPFFIFGLIILSGMGADAIFHYLSPVRDTNLCNGVRKISNGVKIHSAESKIILAILNKNIILGGFAVIVLAYGLIGFLNREAIFFVLLGNSIYVGLFLFMAYWLFYHSLLTGKVIYKKYVFLLSCLIMFDLLYYGSNVLGAISHPIPGTQSFRFGYFRKSDDTKSTNVAYLYTNEPRVLIRQTSFFMNKKIYKILSEYPPDLRDALMGINYPFVHFAEKACIVSSDGSGASITHKEADNIISSSFDKIGDRVVFIEEPNEKELAYISQALIPRDKVFEIISYTKEDIYSRMDFLDRIKITHYDANNIEFNIFHPKGQFIYVSNLYDSDWRAYIDGKRRDVLKANGAFQAVYLEKGEHRISLKYDPFILKLILYIRLIIVVLVMALFFIPKIKLRNI